MEGVTAMFAKRQLSTKIVMILVIMIILGATSALAAPSFSAWSPALSVESIPGSSLEVNTGFLDGCPILSRDGLYLYIASNRPNGLGNLDIWVAERASADGAFGA